MPNKPRKRYEWLSRPPLFEDKPVDRWLALLGVAAGLIVFLLVRTPPTIVFCVVAIFFILCHPVWTFPWIENRLSRRISALILVAAGLLVFAYQIWPPSRDRIINDLATMAGKNDWTGVTEKLREIEREISLHDVVLYFRGLMYLAGTPAHDPDRFLTQIPQDSDLFANAQRLRLQRYSTTKDQELKRSIIESLDRAGLRNPVYYRLKLDPPPYLSFKELLTLYADFEEHDGYLFNAQTFKAEIRAIVGRPFEVSRYDAFEVPGCIVLFFNCEIGAAQRECLGDKKSEIYQRYQVLRNNLGVQELTNSLAMLRSTPAVMQNLEQTAIAPLPSRCLKK